MLMRAALALLFTLIGTAAVRADAIFPMPGPERLALADVVAVIRVVGLEAQDVEIKSATSKASAKYRIAVISVVEPLLGTTRGKTLRVGFPPPPETGKVPRRYTLRAELKPGQVGLLFARNVPGQTFCSVDQSFDFIPRPVAGQPQAGFFRYEPELEQAQRQARLLANPAAGLTAKDGAVRLQTAVLLVHRYRTPRPGATKTEPIAAEESKRILTALLEPDWRMTRDRQTNAWLTFNLLGLTAADGWTAPRTIRDVSDVQRAARVWFREHGEKYRLRRIVPAPATTP